MNHYVVWVGVAVVTLLLVSPPQSEAEARRRSKLIKESISLAVAAACVWFAWWVLSTRCNGGC